MQTPFIQTLPNLHLVGLKADVSLAENKTQELWQGFGPLREKIEQRANTNWYSVEVYAPTYFKSYQPKAIFEKWAAVAVSPALKNLKPPLQSLEISDGLYAVFKHFGPASTAPKTYGYIFGTWLPQSNYQLSNRPHLAIMPTNYNPNAEDGEEEIWIPIELKKPFKSKSQHIKAS